MQLVGAAFGRTGTKSLKAALEMLGLAPCHHMFEVRENAGQLPYWQRAARGEKMDWAEVFREYKACVDWPSARYWREIAATFPDAKVLLTVRDPDAWFDSVQRTILPLMRDHENLDSEIRRQRMAMAYEVIVRQTFDERMDDRPHATRIYRDFMNDVRRTVEPDRLIIYETGSGWTPLCEGLGLAVPDAPFPKTNTTEEFVQGLRNTDRGEA